MLQRLINKKGQNTAEYALLIALVVAGVVAMQTYSQRSLQARVRGASLFLTNSEEARTIGSTAQYEPYYLKSDYTTARDSKEAKILAKGTVASYSNVERTRSAGGYQQSTYDKPEKPDALTPTLP